MNVYTLHEPDTGELRYIGITKTALEKRLRRHLDKVNDCSHRCNWISKLKKNKQKPIIRLLYNAADIDTACVLERFFIGSARHFGLRLVNSSGGGDGVYAPTATTRKKMSEAAKRRFADPSERIRNAEVQRVAQNAPDTVAKKSAAASRPEAVAITRAVMQTEAWKVAHQAGVDASREKHAVAVREVGTRPEFKAKISALTSARWANPEYRARVTAAIRASNPGRPKAKVV